MRSPVGGLQESIPLQGVPQRQACKQTCVKTVAESAWAGARAVYDDCGPYVLQVLGSISPDMDASSDQGCQVITIEVILCKWCAQPLTPTEYKSLEGRRVGAMGALIALMKPIETQHMCS